MILHGLHCVQQARRRKPKGLAWGLASNIEKVYKVYMSSFEWDPEKSVANEGNHGIDFRSAMQIWQGPHVTVEKIAYIKGGETRSATIGLVKGDVYTAIWTTRKDVVRLISVRRARDGEKKIFWEKAV